MTPYTKGPWRVGNSGATVFGPKIENKLDKRIATISMNSGVGESKANTCLIAAAPEMLEAIKAMIPFWCPAENNKDCKIGVDELLALINKAEGQNK